MHLETGIEPLNERMMKSDLILRDKYRRLPVEDKRRQMVDKDAPIRLKTRIGWRHKTNNATDILNTPTFNPDEKIKIKPWGTFENISHGERSRTSP